MLAIRWLRHERDKGTVPYGRGYHLSPSGGGAWISVLRRRERVTTLRQV